jgi:hypothetical protein
MKKGEIEMEYIFGSGASSEVLKTKGGEFTDMTGFQEVVQEYPDATRIDRFRVVEKTGADEDGEGNRYTWYDIDCHNTIIDKSPMLEAKLDYLGMMTGVDLEEEEPTNGTQSEV